MLENITKVVTRFFGIIAGSLSGISAILIAIGFLAERSHLNMLGFSKIPVDLNQYLYTGASLIGFLPGIVIMQSFLILIEPVSLIVIFTTLIFLFVIRIPKINHVKLTIAKGFQLIISRYKIFVLVAFLFVQIYTLYILVQAINIDNLLFAEYNPFINQKLNFLNPEAKIIEQIILSRGEAGNNASEILDKFFTQLFLTTIFIGLTIRYLSIKNKQNETELNFQTKFWLILNYILFATHVFLLPGNYGVLLLNNRYQEVKVEFITKQKKDFSENELSIVKTENRPPLLLNNIRNQQIDINNLAFEYNLNAKPPIFEDPDGDNLFYNVASNNQNIVKATIEEGVIKLTPLQNGNATIVVTAKDTSNTQISTSFSVNVVEKIDSWGMQKINRFPDKRIKIDDKPLKINLLSENSIFKLRDIKPEDASFRSVSELPDIIEIKVDSSILSLYPVRNGNTNVTVFANDGQGRTLSSVFNVTVLGNYLEWPTDEKLLLLYQADNTFYFYSKLEKRIWHIRSEDIESMVFYGLKVIF